MLRPKYYFNIKDKMENPIFYAINYNDPDNNDIYLSIIKGPYMHLPFQSVTTIGCVNITQRYFIKQAKNHRKIIDALGDYIILDNINYKPLSAVLTSLNYSQELIDTIINVVTLKSQDKNVKVHNPNITGGESYGIVNF
jgi:hypothetical protein